MWPSAGTCGVGQGQGLHGALGGLLQRGELLREAKCVDRVPAPPQLRRHHLPLPLEPVQTDGALVGEAVMLLCAAGGLAEALLRFQLGLVIVLWTLVKPVLVQRLALQGGDRWSLGDASLLGPVVLLAALAGGRGVICSPDVTLAEQLERGGVGGGVWSSLVGVALPPLDLDRKSGV